jgi:hypothetical protein
MTGNAPPVVHLLGRCRARRRSLAPEAQSLTIEPLELGAELLLVDTSDGYTPTLNEIIEFLRRA